MRDKFKLKMDRSVKTPDRNMGQLQAPIDGLLS